MKALTALRALARVELRDLRRNRGRSILVVLLVAVPVAALTGAGALVRTMSQTLEELRAERFGRADLRLEVADADRARGARELLPDGAETTTVGLRPGWVSRRGLRIEAFSFELDRVEGDLALAEGLFRVVEGTVPTGSTEIVLARPVAEALSITVGDTVDSDDGQRTVSGIAVAPERTGDSFVLRAVPFDASRSGVLLVALDPRDLDTTAMRLADAGYTAELRLDVAPRDGFEELALFVVGGLGFVEAALVVAAAFAVGLRRRQRELGLLAAGGAPGHLLGPGLLVAPATLATLGAGVGIAVGVGAAFTAEPLLDGWNQRLNGPVEVSLPHLLGGAALGLVAAVGAAAIPVWTALRLPVRTALSGRRPPSGDARGWLLTGLSGTALGLAVIVGGMRLEGPITAVAILAGSVLGVLGLGCTSPWLLAALMRPAVALPPPLRLAVRDAGRFRARNAPVVTAVLAGLSASLLLASLLASVRAFVGDSVPLLRDDQLQVTGAGAGHVAHQLAQSSGGLVGRVNSVRRGNRTVVARAPTRGHVERGPGSWVAAGEPGLLAVNGLEAEDFATSRAIWLRAPAGDPEATPEALELAIGQEVLLRLPVRIFREPSPSRTPLALIPPALVDELGLEAVPTLGTRPAPWLVRLPRPVGEVDLEAAREAAAAVVGTSVDAELLRPDPTRGSLFVALTLSMLTGLLVVFIATALSAVESAADARSLEAVGAPPSLLHATQAARAGYLALVGAALAVPGGLLPGYGLVELADVPLEFAVPWRAIAVVLVGMPALAWTGAWLASRTRALYVDRPSGRSSAPSSTRSFAVDVA